MSARGPGLTGSALTAELRRLEAERDGLEATLLELAAALAEVELEALVRRMVEAARIVAGAAFGAFVEEGRIAQLVGGPQHVGFAEPPDPSRAPLLAGAIASGEVLVVDDVVRWASSDAAQRPYGSLGDGRLVRSWLVLPLEGEEGPAAVLLGHPDPGVFDERRTRLASGLADHLDLALRRAADHRERAHVGHVLQQTLLPPILPPIPGVEVAARYHATGAGNLVGGDFYDLFPVAGGVWGVVLGDVSGFGPEAAAITGQARYTVRAVASTERTPSGVLERLNEAIGGRSDDRYLTGTYLLLQPVPGTGAGVRLARGGHPPAVVLRDDGAVEVVESDAGMPLGLFPGTTFLDAAVDLAPGDALVLYTDGVIEARDDAGRQLGVDGLAAVLARCAGRTADGISRRVELAAIDWQGGRAADDVAIVVLRAAPRR